jgi:hypothetical protein
MGGEDGATDVSEDWEELDSSDDAGFIDMNCGSTLGDSEEQHLDHLLENAIGALETIELSCSVTC